MKVLKLFVLIIGLISFCVSSEAQEVNFLRMGSWQAVLSKAKAENKYIFIDGYATWCKPCKMMDAKVYARQSVGKFINEKFISVKIQTDQSAEDDEYIRSWYKEAAQLTSKYKLSVLPALLFLSPDGELLYRGTGYQDEKKFIGLARFATDPKSQAFHSKVEDYKKGIKNYKELPELAGVVSGVLLDDSLATVMKVDYFDNYVNKLTRREDILTHRNIQFAFGNLWLVKPTNKLVLELRKYPASFSDSVMQWPGGTVGFLSQIVKKDELDWKLWRGNKAINANPDWIKLGKEIAKKYPQIDAQKTIEEFQIFGSAINQEGFFYRIKNWKGINEHFTQDVEGRFAKGELDGVNQICWWYYFCKVTDTQALELALSWMDTVLTRANQDTTVSLDNITGWIDTKAALLYKLGHRKDAIETEEKAVTLKRQDNIKNGKSEDDGCGGFLQTIEKMKKGEKIDNGYGGSVLYPTDWKLLD